MKAGALEEQCDAGLVATESGAEGQGGLESS